MSPSDDYKSDYEARIAVENALAWMWSEAHWTVDELRDFCAEACDKIAGDGE